MSRPYVLINVAATVDGKIDTHERRGAAISSEADRERVDRLRTSVDGVMVGGHTLHDEDPRLTVRSDTLRAERLARGESEQPVRIGVASRLALRPESRFVSGSPGRVIVFVPIGRGDDALGRSGVELYELGSGRVDLVQALATLPSLTAWTIKVVTVMVPRRRAESLIRRRAVLRYSVSSVRFARTRYTVARLTPSVAAIVLADSPVACIRRASAAFFS